MNNLVQILKENNVNVYEVKISKSILDNCFEFISLDSYLDFLKNKNIKEVYVENNYLNINNLLINDSLVNKKIESFSDSLKEEVLLKVKEYNEYISNSNIEQLIGINVVATFDNFIYCYKECENKYDIVNVMKPEEKLNGILNSFKFEIIEENTHKSGMFETQKSKLELFILNDSSFVMCSTNVLRKRYIVNLLQNRLNNDYKELKNMWLNPYSHNEVYQEAIDFIEQIWKKKRTR